MLTNSDAKPRKRESANMELSRIVGGRFLKIRKALNLRVSSVVEAIPKLQRSHLNEWENGRKPIPIWAIAELAKFYGVSTDYILGVNEYQKDEMLSLEVNEAVHAISSHYMQVMTESLKGAIGTQAVTMHCLEDALNINAALCEQVERMIAINPTWFEEEVRNGAKVESLLRQSRKANEAARLATKKNRLANLLPIAESIKITAQPELDFTVDESVN